MSEDNRAYVNNTTFNALLKECGKEATERMVRRLPCGCESLPEGALLRKFVCVNGHKVETDA